MATQVFLNTGGGIFGSIRRRIAEDLNLNTAFEDRIKAGRLRQGGSTFPFVTMTHVSGTLDQLFSDVPRDGVAPAGAQYEIWKEVIVVAVWADNYESARQLGRLMHARLTRQTFVVDCVPTTLFPETRTLGEDTQLVDAADIWHYDFRYNYLASEKILPDQYRYQQSS